MSSTNQITIDEIVRAQERIRGHAHRTPLYTSFLEKSVWLKMECFRPVRSFKIGGAANKILALSEDKNEPSAAVVSGANVSKEMLARITV